MSFNHIFILDRHRFKKKYRLPKTNHVMNLRSLNKTKALLSFGGENLAPYARPVDSNL